MAYFFAFWFLGYYDIAIKPIKTEKPRQATSTGDPQVRHQGASFLDLAAGFRRAYPCFSH